jgi:hypothetical protein
MDSLTQNALLDVVDKARKPIGKPFPYNKAL